jgi:hypothetical protein
MQIAMLNVVVMVIFALEVWRAGTFSYFKVKKEFNPKAII